MKRLLFTILLLSLFAVSCAESTCEELTVDYRASVDEIVERWDDAVAIADTTGRANLAGPVGELQNIKRDTGSIETPECAESAHAALVSYQEAIIDGFLAFMSQAKDEELNTLFSRASDKLELWAVEYSKLTSAEE